MTVPAVVAVEALPDNAPENVVAVTVPPLDELVPLLKFVAVAAFPVVLPEEPETLPVTLPVNGPEKAVELVVPVTARPVEEIVATVDLLTPNRILELPAALLNVPIYRLVASADSIIA